MHNCVGEPRELAAESSSTSTVEECGLLCDGSKTCLCTAVNPPHAPPAPLPPGRHTGLPKGVLNIVHGTHDCVNATLDHPDIAAISLVGSGAWVGVGWGLGLGQVGLGWVGLVGEVWQGGEWHVLLSQG